MNEKLKKLVMAAVLAALTAVATMVVKIPSPLHGYVNFGDCVVLAAGWLLSPLYGFLAAGVGSALADVFSGYALYAPATFLIKGLMALAAFYCYKLASKRLSDLPGRLISGIAAEALMVLGYLAFESVLYGFVPSLANVPANCVQGVAGIIIGTVLIKVLKRAIKR